ncbi:hypothetical protein HB762_27365 (plasmid) [Vibrio campbellii]|uniref:Uncharacterized protein n=1 Tax=Vibrio campbellii TaxID=680 RepID=A0ABY5IMP0_9VIBR|nr:hypothetical protein [Vibrio campbellii]UTZ34986.1 hypothetical protein HB762_27365 [Vibrio campbellii]
MTEMTNRLVRGKQSIDVQNRLERFGDERPFIARDVQEFFDDQGLKTKDRLKVLGINQNRYTQVTKIDADGIDMRHNLTVPQIEIFIRLMTIYPEAQNWHKVTPESVMNKHGFSAYELSDVCCNSESSGERWEMQHKSGSDIKISGYNTLLIETLSRINDPNAREVVLEVAKKVKHLRYNYDLKAHITPETYEDTQNEEWLLPSTRLVKEHRRNAKKIFEELDINVDAMKVVGELTEYARNNQQNQLQAQYDKMLKTSRNPNAKDWVQWLQLTIQWLAAKESVFTYYSWKNSLIDLQDLTTSKDINALFTELCDCDKGEDADLQIIVDFLSNIQSIKKGVRRQLMAETLLEIGVWYRECVNAEIKAVEGKSKEELKSMVTVSRLLDTKLEQMRLLLASSIDGIELCKKQLKVA